VKIGRQTLRDGAEVQDRGSSFFVDSTSYAALDDKRNAGFWRASTVLMCMVVLAATFGIAALLGTIYMAQH
jgi:ABC-type multidrug transport system permease subunit